MRYMYTNLEDPSIEELNQAGKQGWEVYATDGKIYKLKKVMLK